MSRSMTRLNNWICITMIMILSTFTACTNNENTSGKGVSMPINLVIPAGDMTTRSTIVGDPGNTENFSMPGYLYLYIITTESNGLQQISRTETALDPDKWEPLDEEPTLYKYEGTLNIILPIGCTSGKAYAAVAKEKLKNVALAAEKDDIEDQVTYMTFSFEAEGAAAILPNLYASPHNLTYDHDDDADTPEIYYGTILEMESNTPHVDLVLYHVATKVDLIWNIADGKQTTQRLTSLTLNNLKRSGCYLFRPMENPYNATDEDSYSHSFTTTPATQWDGREVFYAIPYRKGSEGNYIFPLNFTIEGIIKTSETETEIVQTFTQEILLTDNIHPSWIRGDIRINDLQSENNP